MYTSKFDQYYKLKPNLWIKSINSKFIQPWFISDSEWLSYPESSGFSKKINLELVSYNLFE